MKTKIFLTALWAMTVCVLGAEKEDPMPTPRALAATSEATGTATVYTSPTPTTTPIRAPQWAPSEAGIGSASITSRKPSPWMSLTGIGIGLPISSNLGKAYSLGFNVELGAGYKVTDQFSLWIDVDLDLLNSKNDVLTNNNNFTLGEAAFWVKYRILTSDLSPTIFFGPGLSYNENRSNSVLLYDQNTGYESVPVNAYEFDFLVEGGLGLDLKMVEGIHAFLQGKMTYDFTSVHFAGFASTDSPIVVVPLEAGVLFGI
jgi:hypothetical protein